MLKVEKVHKAYQKPVLEGLDFELPSSGLVGLLGKNGAGKSTTLKILAGFLQPDRGSIFFQGQKIHQNKKYFQQKTGYLPENNPLYSDLYVGEYLHFVAKNYKLDWEKTKKNPLLERLGILEKWQKKIGTLSKGYRQRLGIAQTLLHEPDFLIWDEPANGLDPFQILEIRSLMKQISQQKLILLSTHLVQEAHLCEKILFLNEGKMTEILPFAPVLHIESSDEKIISLQNFPEIKKMEKMANQKYALTIQENAENITHKIAAFALEEKILITQMYWQKNELERVFE